MPLTEEWDKITIYPTEKWDNTTIHPTEQPTCFFLIKAYDRQLETPHLNEFTLCGPNDS